MTNLDVAGVLKKLSGMSKRLSSLKRYESLSLESYLAEEDIQMIVERLLELIIQASIDINKMFLKQLAKINLSSDDGQPLSNSQVFYLMGSHGFISPYLADRLANSGQFRNILVHLYDDIDPRQVYDALQSGLEQYPDYIEAIQAYLENIS